MRLCVGHRGVQRRGVSLIVVYDLLGGDGAVAGVDTGVGGGREGADGEDLGIEKGSFRIKDITIVIFELISLYDIVYSTIVSLLFTWGRFSSLVRYNNGDDVAVSNFAIRCKLKVKKFKH